MSPVHYYTESACTYHVLCRVMQGMDGKTLIHPSTVAVANWFFGPSAEEVEQSYRIVAAMDEVVNDID